MRVAIGGYIAAVNSFVGYRMDLAQFQRSTLTGDAVFKMGRGETAGENTHVAKGVSDWNWSIDELVALCPNLERVALVVAWFGNDLETMTSFELKT